MYEEQTQCKKEKGTACKLSQIIHLNRRLLNQKKKHSYETNINGMQPKLTLLPTWTEVCEKPAFLLCWEPQQLKWLSFFAQFAHPKEETGKGGKEAKEEHNVRR